MTIKEKKQTRKIAMILLVIVMFASIFAGFTTGAYASEGVENYIGNIDSIVTTSEEEQVNEDADSDLIGEEQSKSIIEAEGDIETEESNSTFAGKEIISDFNHNPVIEDVEPILPIDEPVETTSTKIASVYIVSYKSSAGSSWSIDGHTFLAVRNDSDSAITVGHYNLTSGSMLTVGSWGNIADGKYAYYNIEKYRMINLSNKASYNPNVYYKVEVTASQLASLTTAINNNYTWTNQKNCSRFARYCWNSMFSSSSQYHIDASSTVETPTQMYTKISQMNGYKTNFKFASNRWCTMEYVYRHTASSKASLSADAQKNVKME